MWIPCCSKRSLQRSPTDESHVVNVNAMVRRDCKRIDSVVSLFWVERISRLGDQNFQNSSGEYSCSRVCSAYLAKRSKNDADEDAHPSGNINHSCMFCPPSPSLHKQLDPTFLCQTLYANKANGTSATGSRFSTVIAVGGLEVM